jgi:hypothetical protein
MASLLNNASLLLNPAGSIIAYEEDKIFSVLPSNGAGDFTFSGGDGGTRVNQQGYIEQTPANLITYSEDFSNWTGNLFSNWINSAVTANFAVAPNGTLTADRLGDGYARFTVSATAIPSQTYTFSIYLKNIDLNSNFDVYAAWGLNGTLVSYNPPIGSVSISSLSTTEWKRFEFTVTAPSSGINQMQFGIAPFTGYGGSTSGRYILAWGGMVNIGTTALPYQPTTDRLNYPRITYQNGRGALLSEPQRTNVITYSQQFNQWSNLQCQLTASATISPDGTQNAYLLKADGVANYHAIYQSAGITSGNTYYWSVFVKPAGGFNGNTNTFFLQTNDGSWKNATFNLDDQTVNGSGLVGSFVEKWPNGWYRVGMAITAANTQTATWFIYPTPSPTAETYGGGYYIYGAQLEVGSYPTSYIPTTSATVTRPADISSDTSATSVIGQTAGTLYSNFTWLGPVSNVDSPILSLGDQSYGNSSIVISTYNSGLYGRVTNGISADANINFGTMTPGVQYKCALAYANNDVQFFVNGVNYGQDTGVSIPALGSVYLQNSFPNSKRISTSALFTSRLTNTQLAELTTVRSGSGGNISYYGPYTIHTFTGSGTFTPSFSGQVEVLVVAGGGSGGGQGGNDGSGGGGAGGLLYTSAYGVSSGTGITVTIGAGGAGVGGGTQGNNGSNSIFGG